MLLANRLRRAGSPFDEAQTSELIARLVNNARYELAAQAYSLATTGRAASPSQPPLRNGSFERRDRFPPLDWAYDAAEGKSVWTGARPAQPQGSALFFQGDYGQGGPVASQVLLLPPGRHTLQGIAGNVAGDTLSRPFLTVTCLGKSARLPMLDLTLPAVGEGGGRFEGSFTVPAGCPAQKLVLHIRASDALSDAPSWIDELSVRRGGA